MEMYRLYHGLIDIRAVSCCVDLSYQYEVVEHSVYWSTVCGAMFHQNNDIIVACVGSVDGGGFGRDWSITYLSDRRRQTTRQAGRRRTVPGT